MIVRSCVLMLALLSVFAAGCSIFDIEPPEPLPVQAILESGQGAPEAMGLPVGTRITEVGLLPAQDVMHPGRVAISCRFVHDTTPAPGIAAIYTAEDGLFIERFNPSVLTRAGQIRVLPRLSYREDVVCFAIRGGRDIDDGIWTTRPTPGNRIRQGTPFGSLDRDGVLVFHSVHTADAWELRTDNGALSGASQVVLSSSAPAPLPAPQTGADGFFERIATPQVDFGVAAFLSDLHGGSGLRRQGVFVLTAPNTVRCLADLGSTAPGTNPPATFTNFHVGSSATDPVLSPSCQGGRVAFVAETGTSKGVFTCTTGGGPIVVAANTSTPIPRRPSERFVGFGPQTATNGSTVAFIGFASTSARTATGIYTYNAIDHQLRRVVDLNPAHYQFPGGRTPVELSIGAEAISGARIVFGARFEDGSTGVYIMPFWASPVGDPPRREFDWQIRLSSSSPIQPAP